MQNVILFRKQIFTIYFSSNWVTLVALPHGKKQY